jgi:hypothetical protein
MSAPRVTCMFCLREGIAARRIQRWGAGWIYGLDPGPHNCSHGRPCHAGRVPDSRRHRVGSSARVEPCPRCSEVYEIRKRDRAERRDMALDLSTFFGSGDAP